MPVDTLVQCKQPGLCCVHSYRLSPSWGESLTSVSALMKGTMTPITKGMMTPAHEGHDDSYSFLIKSKLENTGEV